jgi:branched-subunit amino acid aminotransferase/4-amino-4-deoxychorismate lyase
VRNVELNGHTPDTDEVHRLVTVNYGHFTAMQVRGGKVRGLALHMARLDDGNEEFYGRRMDVTDEHRVREWIKHALAGASDASVRVAMVPGAPAPQGLGFSAPSEGPGAGSGTAPQGLGFSAPSEGPGAGSGPAPEVLVAVSDPAPDEAGPPIRVMTSGYQREWPEHKDLAGMAKLVEQRKARQAGYDDALFTGPDDRVREGTTWNVAFWDGAEVVFPVAPMLKGVTMVLLQIAMSMTGVPWRLRPVERTELPDLLAAAAINSRHPAQPIGSIDGVKFAEGDRLAGVLETAWASVPYDEL